MRVLRHMVFLLPALLFCMAPTGLAKTEAPETAAYLDASVLPPTFLPPPPAEGSDTWRAQLGDVLGAQLHITVSEQAMLRAEQKVSLDLITPAVGINFTEARYPSTFAMLARVLADTTRIVEADKKYWHTRRPYLADTRVKLLVDPIDSSPSYPSGHTAEMRVLAEILGLLAPQKRDALRARAEEIAWHRVEAGVHYPADIEAGRLLAMLVVGAMIRSNAFEQDFLAARAEMGRLKAD